MAEDHPQYKDRLFSFIFGSEENKAWTLSLYNAINGSDYTDPDAIEITTIKEVLYLGMHNDVSFLITEEIIKEQLDLFESFRWQSPCRESFLLSSCACVSSQIILVARQPAICRNSSMGTGREK